VNGLLCCSGPAYGTAADLNMTLTLEDLQPPPPTGDWRPLAPPAPPLAAAADKSAADMLTDKTASLDKLAAGGQPAVTSSWREDRTVEWVMESQRMMMVAACRGSSSTAAAPYCGQDCGDGFCYNVWNSMVPV
jgi:hypothetical protein